MSSSDQVAAVRAKGINVSEDPFIDVEFPEDDSTWGTNVPDSITIDQAGGDTVEGDAFILEAVVDGTDPDPTVVWSTTGPEIVRADARRCVVVANQSGTVTATSTADGSVSGSVTYNTIEYTSVTDPAAPSSVSTQSVMPPGTVRFSWPLPDNRNVGRRLYIAEDRENVMDNPVASSFGKAAYVSELELGRQYEATVKSIGTNGSLGSGQIDFTFTPKDPSRFPAAIREQSLPGLEVSPGSSYSLDLSNYAHLTGSGTQSELWNDSDIDAYTLVDSSDVSVSTSGSDLDVSVVSSAATSDKQVPVLLEITRGGRTPVWFGTLVSISASTRVNDDLQQICGVYGPTIDGTQIDPTRLVGEGAEVYNESRWNGPLNQIGSALGVTSNEDGTYDLTAGSPTTGPEMVVFSGDFGEAMVLVSPASEAPVTVPQLPDTVDKVEKINSWISYDTTVLEGASASRPWRRALSGNTLYELNLLEPPEEIYYDSPKLFDGTLMNAKLFPDDAELDGDVVVYRNGLESPAAVTLSPTIQAFNANTEPGQTSLVWRLLVDGEVLSRPVDLSYWKKSAPSEDTTITAQSGVRLELEPETTYQANLYGSQIEFTTRPTPPEITVYGEATPSGGYEYTYELEDNQLDSWTDPFGTQHTSDEVSVQSQEPLSQHRLVLTWTSDEQDVNIETEWRLPDEAVPVEADVATGFRIPAEKVPLPTFTREQFSGTREIVLQNDIYEPGKWQLSPVGYLPPPLDGTVEEYVDAVYVGPVHVGRPVAPNRKGEGWTVLRGDLRGRLSDLLHPGARPRFGEAPPAPQGSSRSGVLRRVKGPPRTEGSGTPRCRGQGPSENGTKGRPARAREKSRADT